MGRLRSLKLINKTVFLMTLLLTAFLLTSLPVFAEQEGDFTYTISNGEATVTGYSWVGGDVSIPDTLGGVPVTSIGDGAFRQFTSGMGYELRISKIILPQGIKSIGSLRSIIIKD